jgi:hypothetical protein
VIGQEKHFYGIETDDGTRDLSSIEKWLAREIDGPGASAIHVLLEKKPLSTYQVLAFFRFVAAQMLRTPTSLNRVSDSLAPTIQESCVRMAKHDRSFREAVTADLLASGADAKELSDFLKLLDGGEFKAEPTRDYVLYLSLGLIEEVSNALAKMKWTFLEVPLVDSDLVLGDHPVVLEDFGAADGSSGLIAVMNPHIEIAMPLSSRMVALAHWDGPISYGSLAEGESARLNLRTLQNAQRFVFASHSSDDLLRLAVELRGTGPKVQTVRAQSGEALTLFNVIR